MNITKNPMNIIDSLTPVKSAHKPTHAKIAAKEQIKIKVARGDKPKR